MSQFVEELKKDFYEFVENKLEEDDPIEKTSINRKDEWYTLGKDYCEEWVMKNTEIKVPFGRKG